MQVPDHFVFSLVYIYFLDGNLAKFVEQLLTPDKPDYLRIQISASTLMTYNEKRIRLAMVAHRVVKAWLVLEVLGVSDSRLRNKVDVLLKEVRAKVFDFRMPVEYLVRKRTESVLRESGDGVERDI